VCFRELDRKKRSRRVQFENCAAAQKEHVLNRRICGNLSQKRGKREGISKNCVDTCRCINALRKERDAEHKKGDGLEKPIACVAKKTRRS